MSTQHAPRIAPVAEPTEEQAALLDLTGLRHNGRALNIFTTLAHHPLLLKRTNALGGAFIAHGQVPPRERELVILRVASRLRCAYEFGQHALLGAQAGVAEAEIAQLAVPLDESPWSADDRTLLQFADELLDDCDIEDETWDALQARMSTEEMLEVMLMVGFYRMLAGFLMASRVELEPGLPEPPEAW